MGYFSNQLVEMSESPDPEDREQAERVMRRNRAVDVTFSQRVQTKAGMNRACGRGVFSLMLDTTAPLRGSGPRQAFVCVNCGRRFNEMKADGSLSRRHITWDGSSRTFVPTKSGAKAGLVSDHIGVYHRCQDSQR